MSKSSALGGASLPYMLRVSTGLVPGMSHLTRVGENADIDTADGFEDIWGGGGHYTGHDATAADVVELVSDSAADVWGVGTGAWTLHLVGLDASLNIQEEDVQLNGLTPVETVGQYLRLDLMFTTGTQGTGGVNAGIVTASQKASPLVIFARMPAGQGKTQIACGTIPAGYVGCTIDWGAWLSRKQGGASSVHLLTRAPGGGWHTDGIRSVLADGNSGFSHTITFPGPALVAGTDIKVSANSSTNNLGVGADWSVLLKAVMP